MLRGVRLVIYDLDGTLIDSREAIYATFNRVLVELEETERPRSFIEPMIGLPLVEMFRRALPARKHRRVQWCWDRYVEIYDDLAPMTTVILHGVPDTLSALKSRGLIQSVATSKRSDVARRLLDRLGLLSNFELVLGINDVPKPKPSPDIVELTLNTLGVEARDAVLVEDTVIGLEAGKKAGVHTVGVTTGTDDRKRLTELKPDAVIDDMRELAELV